MPYFMAKDPALFKEPDEFIPERFDVETTAQKVNPYGYIPFSAGISDFKFSLILSYKLSIYIFQRFKELHRTKVCNA